MGAYEGVKKRQFLSLSRGIDKRKDKVKANVG